MKIAKGKIVNIWKHLDLQNQAIYVEKTHFKKSLHSCQNGASSVEVDISKTQLSRKKINMLKLHEIDVFLQKNFNGDLKL